MSKIITKKDLDLVVESTLKEAGLVVKKPVKSSKNDIVQESVNGLVESMNKTVINEGLSNDMETFNRYINYKI